MLRNEPTVGSLLIICMDLELKNQKPNQYVIQNSNVSLSFNQHTIYILI